MYSMIVILHFLSSVSLAAHSNVFCCILGSSGHLRGCGRQAGESTGEALRVDEEAG